MNTPPCPLTPRLIADLEQQVSYTTISDFKYSRMENILQ